MRTISRLTLGTIALLGAVAVAGAQPAPGPDHRPGMPGAGPMQHPDMPMGNGPGAGSGRTGGMGMGPQAQGMGHGGEGMMMGGAGGQQGHDHAANGRGANGAGANGHGMMMGGDMRQMMAMMQMMHGRMMPMDMGASGMGVGGLPHIEGRIAFLKAELAITEAQTPRWNTFADALRAQAARVGQPASAATTAPEEFEQRIAMLGARSEAMQAVLASLRPLYADLTDEQKKTADSLLREQFMMARRGG